MECKSAVQATDLSTNGLRPAQRVSSEKRAAAAGKCLLINEQSSLTTTAAPVTSIDSVPFRALLHLRPQDVVQPIGNARNPLKLRITLAPVIVQFEDLVEASVLDDQFDRRA